MQNENGNTRPAKYKIILNGITYKDYQDSARGEVINSVVISGRVFVKVI